MSLWTECLVVGGVALELVGAGILAHSHNAESIAELRELVDGEGTAVGEPDPVSTHSKLLAEKRVGFFLLTAGLVLTMVGLVAGSPEDVVLMTVIGAGTVLAGLVSGVLFIRRYGDHYRHQVQRARDSRHPDPLPEQ